MYAAQRRTRVKTIPMGEGWWGAGEKTSLAEDQKVYPFTVRTSEEEIKVEISLQFTTFRVF